MSIDPLNIEQETVIEDCRFEQIKATDLSRQKALLLVAMWTPDDEPDNKPEVLELPHIKEYFEDWGREGDIGFFAISPEGNTMGIVQARYKSSLTEQYSHYPEVAIAVDSHYRGQGVASALMHKLLLSTDTGLRLGVHPKNLAATRLYEKFGFKVYHVAKSGYPQMALAR